MDVLILSTAKDVHATAVSRQLADLGSSCTFLSLEETLRHSVSFSAQSFTVRQPGGSVLDLRSFGSIWNRRPGAVTSNVMPEPWMESLVEHESNRAWAGMLRTLECLWVNHPDKQAQALLKLNQLHVAAGVGLQTPRTLVSNDPAAVRDFFQVCNGQVIYKLVDEGSWTFFPDTESPRGIATTLMREIDLTHVDQVRHSMHLFQERIAKTADIRVTVIGNKIFAARIESQTGAGHVDFRLDYSVPIVNWTLPDDVTRKILELQRAFGLNFGAMDFCLDSQGEHVFLEVNPAGQFLWLEDKLGLPLCASLAQLLSGREQPLLFQN